VSQSTERKKAHNWIQTTAREHSINNTYAATNHRTQLCTPQHLAPSARKRSDWLHQPYP
jgi:hypothetical protein